MVESLREYFDTTGRMDHRVLGVLYNEIISEKFYGEDDALTCLEGSPGEGIYDDISPDYFRRGNTVIPLSDLITAAAERSENIPDDVDGKIISGYGAVIDNLVDTGLLRQGTYVSTSTNYSSNEVNVTLRSDRFGTTPFYDMINISAALTAGDDYDACVEDTYDMMKREQDTDTHHRWLDPLGVPERLCCTEAADQLVAAGVLDKTLAGEQTVWDALITQINDGTSPSFVPDSPFEAIENLAEDYSGAFYRPSGTWQVELFEAARSAEPVTATDTGTGTE